MERALPKSVEGGQRLVDWAAKREVLRIKKESGEPPPWSDDKILNEYRFCNVRRRDDRVSKWVISNVLSRINHFELWTFIQWSSLCRWINWPSTLGPMMVAGFIQKDRIEWARIPKLIEGRREQSLKAWTGAYIIRAPSTKGGYGGMSKATFVADVVVRKGLETVKIDLMRQFTRAKSPAMCQDVHRILESIPNWGSFMAGQVVADWTYTDLLKDAPDLYTWAPMGPGSRRGYNRVMGLPLKNPAPSQVVWNNNLADLHQDIVEALGPEYEETLTLHDVQNCLCEFDKYERARLGEGRPRARYNWRHAARE
jgi:hypothetical protein